MEPNRQDLRIIACPHPFSTDRIEARRPAGGTVSEHMRAIGLDPGRMFARVFIDDRLVPAAEWEQAVPVAGQFVTIRAVPTGGGGDGNKALRLVAMIAVMAVAMYITGGGAANIIPEMFAKGSMSAGFLAAGVSIVGSLAMNAHIPRPLSRRTLPQPMPAPRAQEAA